MLALVLLGFNDSYTSGWGSAATTKGPTNVQMVNEDIRINPTTGKVSVSFTFKNHGEKALTAMAFPEDNYNIGTDKGFAYFRSYVDNKRVEAKRTKLPAAAEDDDNNFWWVKEVSFAKGQTRRVRNDYQSHGFENTERVRGFGYVLSTGATWKGNIERSTAVMDLRGLPKGTAVLLTPKGYTIKNRVATWEWKDFKPTEANNVRVMWVPKKHETELALKNLKHGQEGVFRL